MDLFSLGNGNLVWACEHVRGYSACINCREFLEWLKNC